MERIQKRRLFVLGLLIGGIFLTALGLTDRVLGICGLDRLSSKNEAYLENAQARALRTFAVLSTVKVGLAVVEGTEIGVGFGVEVGDVVQAAYDYVDTAWRIVLAGCVILLGTRMLIETVSLLDHWLLVIALVSLTLMVLVEGSPPRLPRAHRALREIALFMTVLTAACYLILPLSVSGGAYLSKRITAPAIEEATSGISSLQDDLFPDSGTGEEGFLSKWARVKEQLDATVAHLKEKASELVVWVLKLIAGYLFDCLVFPLALFVLLFWLTRVTARALFGSRVLDG